MGYKYPTHGNMRLQPRTTIQHTLKSCNTMQFHHLFITLGLTSLGHAYTDTVEISAGCTLSSSAGPTVDCTNSASGVSISILPCHVSDLTSM